MKVTYIYHSGVMIELKTCVLLFDYWKGEVEFPVGKPRYIFISHAHHDHYNPAVFDMDATVIADSAIAHPGYARLHSVNPGDELQFDGLEISVFGSTDEGVSFLVDVEGKRLFHAGDLNYWHWKDESTMDEIKDAKDRFEGILATLPEGQTDLAMFPVDARIGSDFFLGAMQYIVKFKPANFLPIHFTAHPGRVDEFARAVETKTHVLRADLGISIFEI
ncbi:MAG: MBL fold metallo-hydrolase [Erysipelotrichales bacterium]|nr:MAG: MBL fold metallo-hydrolase [Erysipelotrichales bacterium]